MALSLNQVKQRSQQTTAKSEQTTTSVKKRALSPWEDVVVPKIETATVPSKANPVESQKEQPVAVIDVINEVKSTPVVNAAIFIEIAGEQLEVMASTSVPHTENTLQVSEPLEIKNEYELETKVETSTFVAHKKNSSVKAPSKERIQKEPAKAVQIARSPEIGQSTDGVTIGFAQLTGIQRRLVLHVFSDCFHRASLESSPITIEHFSASLSAAYHSIKKSVDRLKQKGILERVSFKNGRGGWTQYRISRPIYQELTRLKQENALPEIGSTEAITTRNEKLETNWRHGIQNNTLQGGDQHTSSSSDLSSEWDSIEFDSLADIGFTKTHLKQIAQQQKLSAVEIQDSINFFAFDLLNNNKRKDIKGNPLNFFMGIVRRGIPYVPPSNFVSIEDESRIKYLKYLENREKQREDQEQKIKDLEFKNWKANTDLTEALKIMPEYARGKTGPILDLHLEEYFEKYIWPAIMNKFSKTSDDRAQIAKEIQQSLGSA